MKTKKREDLIEKVGMQFNEAAELFSEETLLSMSMVYIVGGGNNTYCGGAQCTEGCNNNCGSGCSGSNSASNSSSNNSSWDKVSTVATAVATVITAIGTLK